ncbi:hypothetical protein D3C84_1095790 [compost metagenome]
MGLNAQRMLLRYMVNDRKQLMQALLRLRGQECNRCIMHEQEVITNILCKMNHRLLVPFDGIPFIHDENRSFACFVGISSNMFVLLDNSLFAVNKDQYDICTLNRF